MLVRVEVARAAVWAAGATIDQPDAGDPARAASAAKVLADEAALTNGKAAIQVHGGMGFTWEVDAHLHLKRAWVLATQFGSTEHHSEALAANL
jgi:alkylation response protein AidB-like acyl-CoA dehydrogenase